MASHILNQLLDFLEKRSFSLAVLLPTGIVLLYSLFLAKPQYEAISQAIIKENSSQSGAAIPGLSLGFLDTGNRVSTEDGYILMDYMQSQDFLMRAEQALHLREHFSDPWLDFWNRLEPQATTRDFLDHFVDTIDITMSPSSAILTFKSRAFEPEKAMKINQFILQESERAINDLNQRIDEEQTRFANQELEKAKEKLIEANIELKEFQLRNGMVSPESETTSLFARISGLEARLVEKKAELKHVSQYMQEDAFQVQALRQEIDAISRQLKEEDAIMVSADDQQSMVQVLHLYERLKLQHEFALTAYTAAFAAKEKTQIEAARQGKFLLVITPPELPDESVYPRPFLDTLTTFAVCLLLFAILRLTVATIRDHTL